VAHASRALLAALLLVACTGDDDDVAVTTTTTSTTTSTTLAETTTTTAPLVDAWDAVPSPDTSCFVVVDEQGDLVIDHNADVPVKPASVLKLLVASLAPDDVRVPAMLRDSDNDAARALAADLGGVDAVEESLRLQGRPMAGVDLLDATGHDHGSRVTCRLLVSVLSGAPAGIRDALAEPGRGTMIARYPEAAGRLRAKTGSIRGVSSLAGYVDGLPFAIVLNADSDPTPAVDALVDGLLR
jgi:D-alanyl-D-alanine carboxypeptidase